MAQALEIMPLPIPESLGAFTKDAFGLRHVVRRPFNLCQGDATKIILTFRLLPELRFACSGFRFSLLRPLGLDEGHFFQLSLFFFSLSSSLGRLKGLFDALSERLLRLESHLGSRGSLALFLCGSTLGELAGVRPAFAQECPSGETQTGDQCQGHGGGRSENQFVATKHFLEPVKAARGARDDRLAIEMSLNVHRQTVGRFVAPPP